jgi:hypothetical protein
MPQQRQQGAAATSSRILSHGTMNAVTLAIMIAGVKVLMSQHACTLVVLAEYQNFETQ